MSLALIRYMEFAMRQNQLHYTIDQLHQLLDQMRITQVRHTDNNVYELLEDVPPDLLSIYKILQIQYRKKFRHKANL